MEREKLYEMMMMKTMIVVMVIGKILIKKIIITILDGAEL